MTPRLTYTLTSGEVVTSRHGDWPTQYANRTQAATAAAKIPGATVIQRGRPFYVRLPTDPAPSPDPDALRREHAELHAMLTRICDRVYEARPDSTGHEIVQVRRALIDAARALLATTEPK